MQLKNATSRHEKKYFITFKYKPMVFCASCFKLFLIINCDSSFFILQVMILYYYVLHF